LSPLDFKLVRSISSVHPSPGRRSIAAIVALTAFGLAGTRAEADDVKLVDPGDDRNNTKAFVGLEFTF
jgi:hypothetical protein